MKRATELRSGSVLIVPLLAIALLFSPVWLKAQESESPSHEQKAASADKSARSAPKPAVKPVAAKKEVPYTYARFWPKWFQIGLTYRGRLEKPSGRSFANDEGDGYYLSRLRLEMTVRPNKYVDFFAMAQDASVYQYNNLSRRPSGMTDALDLRQAYADIHFKKESQSLALRIGRQYIDLGSKRLIAVSSWSNAPPSYDAAKLTYSRPGLSADVFAATRISNVYAYRFNEPKKGENLYGAYLSLDKLVPKAKVEPFLLWRTQPSVSDELKRKGDSDLVTTGFRFFGKLRAGFDYTSEMAFQRGTYAQDDVSAWAGTWGVGYLIKPSRHNPKINFEYNYASGDQAKGDGVRGTFDQLYASNHSLYGIADQVGWRNASNYKIGVEVDMTKRLRLQFDVNDFYLATLADALYADNGSSVLSNAKATSKHIGYEPDLQVTFKMNQQVSLGAGFARVIPGRFLKESTAGYSYNYPYVFWEFKY